MHIYPCSDCGCQFSTKGVRTNKKCDDCKLSPGEFAAKKIRELYLLPCNTEDVMVEANRFLIDLFNSEIEIFKSLASSWLSRFEIPLFMGTYSEHLRKLSAEDKAARGKMAEIEFVKQILDKYLIKINLKAIKVPDKMTGKMLGEDVIIQFLIGMFLLSLKVSDDDQENPVQITTFGSTLFPWGDCDYNSFLQNIIIGGIVGKICGLLTLVGDDCVSVYLVELKKLFAQAGGDIARYDNKDHSYLEFTYPNHDGRILFKSGGLEHEMTKQDGKSRTNTLTRGIWVSTKLIKEQGVCIVTKTKI